LLVDGQPAKLGARALDLLLTLIEHRARVVSKNELLDLVWPGLVVEEGNLTVHMAALRKLLGPGAVATIPGRGYKFALKLEGLEAQVPLPTTRADAAGAAPMKGNLPLQLAPLYGRDEEVAAIQALIERHQLVSLVGPGGIGKTRLAQAVAHSVRGQYQDGEWIVELAPLVDPALVAPTIARLLGHAPGLPGKALTSLVEAMREQQLLLVLDNCEHLSGLANELAAVFLAGAPGVHMLVTSQEPLRLAQEQVVRIRPLAVPQNADATTALDFGAVALFAARARAADARFVLSEDNVAAVIDVCTHLDGIALAIELAAARVSLLGVQGLRQRLGERLRLLAGGERAALPRHRTLRAALEWSYSLLSDDERMVLDRLGIFVGSFSLEAAQKVAVDEKIDEWAVLDHLSTLVDKSLVLVEGGEPPRYRLLESNRAFAVEQLQAAGTTEVIRRRHAHALVHTLGKAGLSESPSARMNRNAPDLDNVRAAVTWALGPGGDRQIAIELMGATDRLWYFLGCNDEGARLFRTIEPWVGESTPPAVAARFWQSKSELLTFNSVRHEAEAGLRAAALFRGVGDSDGLFLALASAANAFSIAGERVAAEQAIAEARGLLGPTCFSWVRGYVEFLSAQCSFFCMRGPEEARRHFLAAVELTVPLDGGDAMLAEMSEMKLLLVDHAMRHFGEVVRSGRELLGRSKNRVGGFTRAIVSVTLGAALAAIGELADAETTLRASMPLIKRATGTVSWGLNHVVVLVARQGRLEDAARLIGYIDGSRTEQTIVQSPSQRSSYEEASAVLERALSKSDFERLRGEGRSLIEDQAAALALPERKRIELA
jgi:predicted ATPase/DNA-binding winged helix-turn-helix (wHTH) protein